MDSPPEPVSPPSGDEMPLFTIPWRSREKSKELLPPMMEPQNVKEQDTPLLQLPQEIVQQILHLLPCQSLVTLSRTCRQLRNATYEDLLWSELLRPNVPVEDFPENPYPSNSYRDLYITHHPYWFVPRQRIWISDDPHIGRVMLCKFDSRRGCIEGYRLLASRGESTSMLWPHNHRVVIHTFNPDVYLWLDDPVLKLDHDIVPFSTKQGWWEGEIRMKVGRPGHNTNASFFLCRDVPTDALHRSMEVWPPMTIPGMPRVRSASIDKFRGKGHKPQKYEDISQTTFRMRHWSQFASGMSSFGVRIGEEVSTWSTLDPSLYTPTKEKPYQGIFVGDYAGHGCEFLLVMQTDKAPPAPEPNRPSRYAREGIEDASEAVDEEDHVISDQDLLERLGHHKLPPKVTQRPWPLPEDAAIRDDESVFTGALEAIKLTGDPNVPRGEHTFIADDIGSKGFIRNAMEKPFVGARVVKSRGHVAARGFIQDEYIPSQLLMISHNKLAQYWLPFGHISFYERVDVDQLMQGTFSRRASQ